MNTFKNWDQELIKAFLESGECYESRNGVGIGWLQNGSYFASIHLNDYAIRGKIVKLSIVYNNIESLFKDFQINEAADIDLITRIQFYSKVNCKL